MVDQLDLFDHEKPKTEIGTCSFGYPWPCGGTKRIRDGGCPGCRAYCAQTAREVRRKIREGIWNRRCYTKREWIAAGRAAEDWQDAPPWPRRDRLAIPDAEPVADRDVRD
jgi:hypothetical protein